MHCDLVLPMYRNAAMYHSRHLGGAPIFMSGITGDERVIIPYSSRYQGPIHSGEMCDLDAHKSIDVIRIQVAHVCMLHCTMGGDEDESRPRHD